MNKISRSFEEAVAEIFDGASVAMNNWGLPGGPQNLMLALREHGAKDLTVITPNFMYTPFPEEMVVLPSILLPQIRKVVTGAYHSVGKYANVADFPSQYHELERNLDLEVIGLGNFNERLRAGASGMGPFYSPVGVGTIVEEGKEKRIFDGKEYILLEPIKPDYAFVRAHKADQYGNLVYNGIARCTNPVIAMAGKVTIAEVDEIVEPGELAPDEIVTPAAFVDHIVANSPGARGSYKYTMEKLHELLSVESIRTAFFAQAKRFVEKEEDK